MLGQGHGKGGWGGKEPLLEQFQDKFRGKLLALVLAAFLTQFRIFLEPGVDLLFLV